MRRIALLLFTIAIIATSCGDIQNAKMEESASAVEMPPQSPVEAKQKINRESAEDEMESAEESAELLAGAISQQSADLNQPKRKVIANASISIQTNSIENEMIALKEQINARAGHVHQYKIDKDVHREKHIKQNKDSVLVVKEVVPHASMSVRIPTQQADSFVFHMLSYGQQISRFYLSEEDITENLFETNAIGKVYDKSIKTHTRKRSVNNVSFDNENSIAAIRKKAESARMNHKTNYLWFDIQLEGGRSYSQQMIAGDQIFHSPFSVRFMDAIQNGWYILTEVLIALLNLWPLILLGLLGLFVFRRYRPRTA